MSIQKYRLIKSEPSTYSRDDFVRDGRTMRDGVRNFLARNNLRDMNVGDQCFWYHSNEGKEIVGIAKVVRKAYADPTAVGPDGQPQRGDWVVVDVEPVGALKHSISLEMIKNDTRLADMELLRLQRLSVSKVTKIERDYIVDMSNYTS